MSDAEHGLDFAAWSHERVRRFESYARAAAPQAGREPKRLTGALRYALLGGGKRVRPLLAYAAGLVTEAPEALVNAAALSLEMIHSYSLVHDDMPSMDNDVLRRGQPTVHVQYGEALAMLAGDALQAEAFDVLSHAEGEPERVLRMIKTLSRASGIKGMCGGQALDLAMVGQSVSETQLFCMQSMKTGALIRAAVLMGAQAGEWPKLSEGAQAGLAVYAQALGLAFQVTDDILDCTQATEVLGKTAGKDEEADKPTWVSLLGLEGAKARAATLRAEMQTGLDMVAADAAARPEGVARLAQIADFVLARDH